MKNQETILLHTSRTHYSAEEAARESMTITEVIEELEKFVERYGEDCPVIFSNDDGYTYGRVEWGTITTNTDVDE